MDGGAKGRIFEGQYKDSRELDNLCILAVFSNRIQLEANMGTVVHLRSERTLMTEGEEMSPNVDFRRASCLNESG